jgi:hypothetical protein
MGNRALVIFCDDADTTGGAGVYLHWNGGPESIYPMLDYLSGKAGMNHSASYTMARFCQAVGNFFGGTTSLGILPVPALVSDLREQAASYSHGDNGLYLLKIAAGSYGIVGRYMDGAWLDGDVSAAERERAILSRHGREMTAHLAPLNDPFFNR